MKTNNITKSLFFDSHTHYNLAPLNENLDENINNLIENNIFINLIGVDLDSSKQAIKIAKKYQYICSVGIHPCECYNLNENDLSSLEKLIIENKVVIKSIGECGLDFHYPDTNEEKQIYFLKKQIELANRYNLNLIIHVREAHHKLIPILTENKFKQNVIIHCFDGDINIMNEYIKLGCYISVSGNITFKKNIDLQAAIKKIDITRLLTETDSPYLSPVPLRGKVNNSLNIKIINQFISELKEINFNVLNKQLKQNFIKVFLTN